MGPLEGVKIVEFAGIGPGPMCAMLLADMGADVLRLDRAANVGADPIEPRFDPLLRGRKNAAIDLKHPHGVATALRLTDAADILIEGFRPGVMERLGLGPAVVHQRNPGLVYGRMTGWGQTGPMATKAGHDINYIALTGALHAIGTAKSGPVPPLNLVGDFGGGALYLAMGVLAAYIRSARSGEGQVVDAAMAEGAASLMSAAYGHRAEGRFHEHRGTNRLDGGSHHYSTYETADGEHVAVGANEPKFYQRLLTVLGLDESVLPAQTDREQWPLMRQRLADIFITRTRDEWVVAMADEDICFAPVLSMSESLHHPHNVARETFVTVDDVPQPAPVPRFSATPGVVRGGSAHAGQHTREALVEWGLTGEEVTALEADGAVRQR